MSVAEAVFSQTAELFIGFPVGNGRKWFPMLSLWWISLMMEERDEARNRLCLRRSSEAVIDRSMTKIGDRIQQHTRGSDSSFGPADDPDPVHANKMDTSPQMGKTYSFELKNELIRVIIR